MNFSRYYREAFDPNIIVIIGRQQKEDGSDVSLNMFVSLLRKGFYLLCALMLFGFSSTNWILPIFGD